MPKGRVAPGNVLPPPAVPMNGSTESYGLRLDWARAGRIERTKKKTRQKRRKTRTRIPCVLGEKVSPKANHSSPPAACADGDGGDTSVVRHTDDHLCRAARARVTFWRMSEAFAVQMKGFGFLLWWSM